MLASCNLYAEHHAIHVPEKTQLNQCVLTALWIKAAELAGLAGRMGKRKGPARGEGRA